MTESHKKATRKWRRRELTLFFEKLGLYISSGLAIDAALRLCMQGTGSKNAASVEALRAHIERGFSFASGLAKYFKLSQTVCGIISHGESAGNLLSTINVAKDMIEREDEIIKKCLGAMVYPCVIGIFCILFVIGIMRGVMPQIVPMLEGLHTELPFITRAMIGLSNVISHFGLYIGLSFVCICIIFFQAYKRVRSFRSKVQASLTKVPLIGNLVKNFSLAVFLRSFGSLVDSGLAVSKSYYDSMETMSFLPLKNALKRHSRDIADGMPVNKAFEYVKAPQYVIALVFAGDSSGTLGISIIRAGDILSRDIDDLLKKMTTLIEPIMMAVMGLVVGSIALSILMPIYDLSKTLQH